MKPIIYKSVCLIITAMLLLPSCDDFLDKQPESTITPEAYLNEESQLAAFTINLYTMFPSHSNYSFGTFTSDTNTDNQAALSASTRFVPEQHKVGQSGGDWGFGTIRQCNYFLNDVLPKYEANQIKGSEEKIRHYIGEMYFLRAYQYFKHLVALGDFPIVTVTLNNDQEELVAASNRSPRNEVARFILSDLDKAIEMMMSRSVDGKKNRLSRQCAYLFKSRVALFEGTWLKYFKGTAFVPNGDKWPGASSNQNYQFPSGNIDSEINFFLDQAIEAADAVASSISLVENTGLIQQSLNEAENPYMAMFYDTDMSKYDEVLFWRKYDDGLGITNNVPIEGRMNQQTGLTRGYVDGFLMADGTPTYDAQSGYSDETIQDVRKNRDNRLYLFLKEPGQKNIFKDLHLASHGYETELIPPIIGGQISPTGYIIRKGVNPDGIHHINGHAFIGAIVFRGVEAYLNYIEAYYERHGSLGGKSGEYWNAVRNRAKLPGYSITIAKTDVSKEAKNDWAAYSGGSLIDPTLYSIRRERRCELIAEGLRYLDLRRWRAMDQMVETPYHIEGMKLWGEMEDWYVDDSGKTQLKYGGADANVSSPQLSTHMRPYQVKANVNGYNGYKWKMAHYLSPIATKHFQLTSPGGEYEKSVIYQNPGWSREPNSVAKY